MTTISQPGVRRRIRAAATHIKASRTMTYDLETTPGMPADAQLVCHEARQHLLAAETCLRGLFAREEGR